MNIVNTNRVYLTTLQSVAKKDTCS